jgi:hypothetical protein
MVLTVGILLDVVAIVLVAVAAFARNRPGLPDLLLLAIAFWLAGLLVGGAHL